MAMSDPLGDMLTRIRNGQMAGKSKIHTPSSKLRSRVLQVLKDQGFIRDFKETTKEHGQSAVDIELKYFEGTPVIREIKRVSKPGRRVYSKIGDLQPVYNGLGISILSRCDVRSRSPGSKCRWRSIGRSILGIR